MKSENIDKKISIIWWLYILGTVFSIIAICLEVFFHLTAISGGILLFSAVALVVSFYLTVCL